MLDELCYMLERFPEYRRSVLELFQSNDDFRLLCKDYWDLKTATSQSDHRILETLKIKREYRRLSDELEKEALRFLSSQTKLADKKSLND